MRRNDDNNGKWYMSINDNGSIEMIIVTVMKVISMGIILNAVVIKIIIIVRKCLFDFLIVSPVNHSY